MTTTMTTNAERMQKLDDAWNARDWDMFNSYHEANSVVVYWPGQEDNPTRGGHDHRAELPDGTTIQPTGKAFDVSTRPPLAGKMARSSRNTFSTTTARSSNRSDLPSSGSERTTSLSEGRSGSGTKVPQLAGSDD
jgi:hypothetical protein